MLAAVTFSRLWFSDYFSLFAPISYQLYFTHFWWSRDLYSIFTTWPVGTLEKIQRLTTDWKIRWLYHGKGEIFRAVQTGPEAHSTSCRRVTGSFSGVKWPERNANHRPTSNAGLRMGRSYSFISPLWLHRHVIGWHLPFRYMTQRKVEESADVVETCQLLQLSRQRNNLDPSYLMTNTFNMM